MSSVFWVGVAQSAIGSGVGFAFGICAFHYQQKRQDAKKENGARMAALDALNRLTNAAGANIETLVNFKLQYINDLKPEVALMKAASMKAYETPFEERDECIPSLNTLISSMRFFYMSFPPSFVMQPPEFVDYSSLSKDMPALLQFVHRAMGMTQEINDRIESRNARLAESARENSAGMNAGRVLYYTNMLSDEGNSICEHVDYALDFWRLVIEQIEAYGTGKKDTGVHLIRYQMLPKAAEAMPDEELFPKMREQLKTSFD